MSIMCARSSSHGVSKFCLKRRERLKSENERENFSIDTEFRCIHRVETSLVALRYQEVNSRRNRSGVFWQKQRNP